MKNMNLFYCFALRKIAAILNVSGFAHGCTDSLRQIMGRALGERAR